MLNNHWSAFLDAEFAQPYFQELSEFLREEYAHKKIYPQKQEVFSCFYYTDLPEVKVVILGQDPYHQPNQAHGMCFSVKPGVAIPPSLLNIYKELHDDLGCYIPDNGSLIPWAQQGVLLLNAVMTVEQSKPLSHRGRGWETFTDHVLLKLNQQAQPIVYLLWGRAAQNKALLVDNPRHLLIKSAHPSPFSAANGFFGTRPFSQANAYLTRNRLSPIDWQIKNLNV